MIFNSVGHDFRHSEDFKLIRPNGLKEYLLLIIRSDAWFIINNEKMRLKPNSMIMIEQNTPHSFGADGGRYINDWVAFNFDAGKEGFLFDKIVFNKFAQSNKIVQDCSDLIKLMQNERLSGEKEMISELLFKVILIKFQSAFEEEEIGLHKNKMSEIRNLIYNTPTEEYSVQKLADKAYMSKSYFQHLYKQCFNTTPIKDVIASRINYSKQLLFTTDYLIKTISEILNYENDIQFIKQFKLLTGESPGQYRKRRNG